jgi:hypothetical protein
MHYVINFKKPDRSNMNAQNYSIKRRSSRTSLSINNASDDLSRREESFNAPLSAHEDVSVISEEKQQDFFHSSAISGHFNNTSYVSSNQRDNSAQTSDLGVHMTNEISEVDEVDFNKCFPWVKVVAKLMASVNYECKHYNMYEIDANKNKVPINFRNCSNDCYLKLYKSSHCLLEAVLRVYDNRKEDELKIAKRTVDETAANNKGLLQTNKNKLDVNSYKFRKVRLNFKHFFFIKKKIKQFKITKMNSV